MWAPYLNEAFQIFLSNNKRACYCRGVCKINALSLRLAFSIVHISCITSYIISLGEEIKYDVKEDLLLH